MPHEEIDVWTVALKQSVICFRAAVLDQSALRNNASLPRVGLEFGSDLVLSTDRGCQVPFGSTARGGAKYFSIAPKLLIAAGDCIGFTQAAKQLFYLTRKVKFGKLGRVLAPPLHCPEPPETKNPRRKE